MKVTKAQAQANRTHIVETASSLFREHGFDGVGVADLMAAAGFTHGGFYKHFGSKVDLMAESAACGTSQTAALLADADIAEVVRLYLSREHRDARAAGCTMAALGGDAARQPTVVRATFAEGIERLSAALRAADTSMSGMNAEQARARSLVILAQMVGAIVMSRACPDDSSLADEILASCRNEICSSLTENVNQNRT
ncbi:TetR/AcrR family transcriptional regulator [Pseudoduganella plicata]|nr:TetR family transcriptional regulator [Pseudoduganella plicata]QBQ37068.1 TetR family transcriptional regulator [Pseudoduganella plicata]